MIIDYLRLIAYLLHDFYRHDCRGYDKWRLQDESSLFDCNVLKKRINDTVEMVRQGDVFRLMFRLRGGLARDQYGESNPCIL